MAESALPREEGIGLGVAVVAHVLLVALLVLRPFSSVPVPPPERITVTLSEEVGLTSTSPEPMAQPAPDEAPELGALPEPVPHPEPLPPLPKPPVPKTATRPLPKAMATPSPRPSSPPQAKPAKPANERPGASRIGSDFLKGIPGAANAGSSRNPPAAAIGPAVRSALAGALSREIKPHWAAPQGAEAELLVTYLSFSLNPDGSLAGKPTLVRQEGITDANRAQAARHAEQAIRAVQLAAPFDLPNEYYDAWKRVTSFRFDRRLSQ